MGLTSGTSCRIIKYRSAFLLGRLETGNSFPSTEQWKDNKMFWNFACWTIWFWTFSNQKISFERFNFDMVNYNSDKVQDI